MTTKPPPSSSAAATIVPQRRGLAMALPCEHLRTRATVGVQGWALPGLGAKTEPLPPSNVTATSLLPWRPRTPSQHRVRVAPEVLGNFNEHLARVQPLHTHTPHAGPHASRAAPDLGETAAYPAATNTWDQDINEWRTLTSGAKLLGEQEEKERMRREVGPEPTLATQEQKEPQAHLSPLNFFLFPFLFI